MSAPPPAGSEPASAPHAPSAPDDRGAPAKTRTERAGTVLAWLVPPLFIAAAVLALLPVQNGRAQDCGTPLAFVFTGRTDDPLPDVDRPGQPDEPPTQFTEEEYRRAAENPCRTRAGTRMGMAAALAGAGLVLGLVGLVCLLVGRYWVDPSAAPADGDAGDGTTGAERTEGSREVHDPL